EGMFGHQVASSREPVRVPYACPQCRHLGLGTIPPTTKLFDGVSPDQHPDGAVEFLIALECENKSCESRVEVLAPMERGTDDIQATRRVQNWIDDGLKCPEGHRLWKPLQIA